MNEVHPEVCQGVVVAEPAWIKPVHKDKYGGVTELDEEELADPEELERQINREVWGPVLMLPKPKLSGHNPGWDWSVDVDFSAFASVDFDRTQPQFDKLRYKADKLNEEVKDLIIRFEVIKERIPGRAKYAVLRRVESGVLDIGDIPNCEMYFLAELYMRIRRMQKEVERLREASSQKRLAQQRRFWESLGC